MQQMVEAMEEIRVASQSVANVIKVIEEIAFQTNMLALNAAVEAAHAGQHGKGFAVVAEEVRNLAARSAKAAKETADLIAGSVSKTENGAKIADQTAAALGEITTRIAQASDLVRGIALLLESDINAPVNIGNPHELTVKQLAQAVIKLTGSRSRIAYKPLPADDPQVRRPDIRQARAKLGWKPEVQLAEGLSRTIEYFRA